jgi:hypothetical protein
VSKNSSTFRPDVGESRKLVIDLVYSFAIKLEKDSEGNVRPDVVSHLANPLQSRPIKGEPIGDVDVNGEIFKKIKEYWLNALERLGPEIEKLAGSQKDDQLNCSALEGFLETEKKSFSRKFDDLILDVDWKDLMEFDDAAVKAKMGRDKLVGLIALAQPDGYPAIEVKIRACDSTPVRGLRGGGDSRLPVGKMEKIGSQSLRGSQQKEEVSMGQANGPRYHQDTKTSVSDKWFLTAPKSGPSEKAFVDSKPQSAIDNNLQYSESTAERGQSVEVDSGLSVSNFGQKDIIGPVQRGSNTD